MSDTVPSTAPVQPGSSEASLLEAGARRLAALSTAAPATSETQASPEAKASTAAAAQSEAQPPQDNPDGTLPEPEPGETEAEQQQAEDPDPVAFKLDDGTPVRASEARQGYLRQQDYSQKTQSLAQGRNHLKGMLEEANSYREAAAQIILGSLPAVDESLRQNDPAVWAVQRLEREDALRRVAELRAQSSSAREQIEQIDQHEFDQTLVRLHPHLSQPGVADKEREVVQRYVSAKGWPAASVERAKRDPFVVAAVLDAAKFQAVRQGSQKGGETTAARKLQPSPTIAQAQTRPAPVGTAAFRQQQGQTRSGDAVRTQPGRFGGQRTRIEQGAMRLSPIPVRA